MAVNALIGWGVRCNSYAKLEGLMCHRAVLEGMPAMDGGQRSDPKMFFGKDTYNYLTYWHTKRMSSTREDFLRAKGIRGLFTALTHYDPVCANGEEKVKEQKELATKLLKDKAKNLDCRSL
jgi:hypothetical protein